MTNIPANGYTGALAMQSTDTGGVVRYLPAFLIDPTTYDGQEPVMLINNTAYPVNVLQGTAFAIINVRIPLLVGVHNADFFARTILSGIGDTGASGYHTVTVWSDNVGGDTAKTYARCKVASLALTCQYSQQAAQSIAFLDMQIISCDPESAAIPALAAAPSGPLSRGQILTWSQSAFTGASDMVMYALNVSTGYQFIPGNAVGTGPYPVVPKGIMLNTVAGTVTLRQIRNPATTLVNGTHTAQWALGGVGISFAAQLRRMMNNKRQPGGINFLQSQYFLDSNDGTSPLAIANLP